MVYIKGRTCRCSHGSRKSRQLFGCECGWNGSLHGKLGQYSQGDEELSIEALWVAYFFLGLGLNQMRWAKLMVQLCHTLRTMRRARAQFYLPAILWLSYLVLSILSRHLSPTGLLSQSSFVSVITLLPFPGSSLVDISCGCEYVFTTVFRVYFVKYFWGH